MLKDRYAPLSVAQLRLHEDKFTNSSVAPGSHPVNYFQSVRRTAGRLAQLGSAKSEQTVCLQFQCGLPDEFNLVRSQLVPSRGQLTFENVQSAIENQYDLLAQGVDTANAFVARAGNKTLFPEGRSGGKGTGKMIAGKGKTREKDKSARKGLISVRTKRSK